MVKWLSEITVSSEESQNFYHFMDNRVLPSHVDEALAKEQGTDSPRVRREEHALLRFTTLVICAVLIALTAWSIDSLRLLALPCRLVVQARLYHQ